MQRPIILLLTAIHPETAAIARQFNQRPPQKKRPLHFTHNQYQLHLHTIGIGAIRLPTLDTPPSAIILAGLAGALDPTLSIADILIDESSTWPSHQLPFPRRKIHTSAQLITTPAEKSALFSQTSAAAVEMENSAVLQFANQTQTPFLHIRSISDQANHPINPAILKFVDPFGQVKPAPLIAALARRPNLIPQLRRLSHDSKLALAALGHALKLILSSPDTAPM